ncbi:hypothetical protein FIU97_01680 [Roseivivax sp. THAF40]|uniref:hypothetical protein n=1 Tax=unclassified Roseivivax TaxID=2639302 RepID=UPI0012690C75|nr:MULTISPECIES: hypothetical protein [unclassified Roseivivax]QFS81544.1 hypothetical protein FIV09_01770 [Roseivivax sp. THAF197b]QFT45273.1 hypothetical protein FIU97_01680 [Roseivivax sp. THAF40]
MPLQNRVTPFGEIVTASWRGAAMGNRGRLHDEAGRLQRARWKGKAWITCLLAFKGRHREIMKPDSYTELFFPDEAAAMAAGHRPCAECRRADFNAFRAAFAAALPEVGASPKAAVMDAHLHAARLAPHPVLPAIPEDLPDGAFISSGETKAYLKWRGAWWLWQGAHYAPADPPLSAPARLLTPAPMIAVLKAGYTPGIAPNL